MPLDPMCRCIMCIVRTFHINNKIWYIILICRWHSMEWDEQQKKERVKIWCVCEWMNACMYVCVWVCFNDSDMSSVFFHKIDGYHTISLNFSRNFRTEFEWNSSKPKSNGNSLNIFAWFSQSIGQWNRESSYFHRSSFFIFICTALLTYLFVLANTDMGVRYHKYFDKKTNCRFCKMSWSFAQLSNYVYDMVGLLDF